MSNDNLFLNVMFFTVWIRNRALIIISAGFEPVLSYTEKIMYINVLQTIFNEFLNKNHK